MKLSFHGAAGTVTGSRYLLEANGTRIQVDCGLFQGLKRLRLLNWERPAYDPRAVDHLLLTHGHIDHSGYLPRQVREGFTGQVHCTPATADLADLLLMDSAKIQEEDAVFANKKGFSKHKPAQPLYSGKDAAAALQLFRAKPYGEWLKLPGQGKQKHNGVRACFHNMGHILGASCIELRVEGEGNGNQGRNGRNRTIVFSGDVGRTDVPLHTDPDPRPECDVLIVESTYGDRRHIDTNVVDQIREPFLKTLERGGVVLIPAFAVGRSQLVTLILRDLMRDGELPEVPIHIDSPMAIDATKIYSRHLYDCNLDEELVQDGRSRLFPRQVHFHRTVAESKHLNALGGPRVIISASGMMTAGRILHHLVQRLPDKKNLVLIVGYQAMGTRGRSMLEGAKSLKIHGHKVPVRAEFQQINGLSSHADCDELMAWITSAETMPETVIITHGEPKPAAALAERIEQETGARTFVPQLRDEFDCG